MNTFQERILDRIEALAGKHGVTCTSSSEWGNVGQVNLHETGNGSAPEAFGLVRYNFQSSSYTLSLTMRGRRIPSQPGRADYFDFCQRNDDATRFWVVLECELAAREMSARILGMGGHQSARMDKAEWLTPPALLCALGPFDLDPCAPAVRPWPTAAKHFTLADDGLAQAWSGRVWCNPPYGAESAPWLRRCAEHGNAVALIFARTETEMFFECVWDLADAVCFIRGRLYFHHCDGTRAAANSGAPSALIAYGRNNIRGLRQFGKCIEL